MDRKLGLSVLGAMRFLVMFGIIGWLWWFLRSYFLFIVLVLMVICAGISGVSLWWSRNGLCAELALPKGRVGRNVEFPFGIRIHNPRKFVGFTADIKYHWGNVFTGQSQKGKEHLWIAPGKGYESQKMMISRYAGRLDAVMDQFCIFDVFHLFYIRDGLCQDAWTTAYPGFEEVAEEELYSCVEGFPKENESKKRGTDYNPDYEVREYIPGDELKSIHWKLTAKQNRMMVRERLASGREKIHVLLPLADDKDENDKLMEALQGLGQILLAKEYPIQLSWPDAKGESLQTRFIAEQGEFEGAIGEILSNCGLHVSGDARQQMEVQFPGESYIVIQTGAYKGAYVRC